MPITYYNTHYKKYSQYLHKCKGYPPSTPITYCSTLFISLFGRFCTTIINITLNDITIKCNLTGLIHSNQITLMLHEVVQKPK